MMLFTILELAKYIYSTNLIVGTEPQKFSPMFEHQAKHVSILFLVTSTFNVRLNYIAI